METKNNDVLWENEIAANKLMTNGLIVLIVMFCYVLFSFYQERNVATHWDNIWAMVACVVFIIICLVAGVLVSRHCKYEKPWLKYLLMADMFFALAFFDVMETFYITIIIVLPIVLSSRYFSKKYTRDVAIISFFIFFATTALGVYFGMYSNVNNLYFPKHTVLYLGDQSYIMDAMGAGYIKFDHLNMLYHELVDTYSGEVIQGLIIAIISYLIASHGRKMVFQQKDLTENTARVGAELNLATKIQADMLPSVFPAFPRREEFDLFASMTPAKEVGGDFYDFFMIDDDHLGLVIADVSGKGIPAAMFMMFTKNIIANNAMRGMPPAEALRNANDQVCANNTEDMFVTVWLGVLTISTGNMICSSAGHEYPVLKHGDGGYELLKDPHGLAVGFIDGSEYTEYEIQFDPGDKLFVYTDGVPEATDANKEMFGTDRIVETLNKDVDASCEQMLKNIWDAVDDFVGEAEQFDDLTMLSVEYRGL